MMAVTSRSGYLKRTAFPTAEAGTPQTRFESTAQTWYASAMDDGAVPPLARGTFRATITGVGRPGPIEERLGWRLVRIVDPASKEGATLLRDQQVTFIGPEGTALGRVNLDQARRMLQRRLESVLARLDGADGAEAVREGLVRLRRASPRVGRA